MQYEVKNIFSSVRNARQIVEVPGSKSITARALLIAALAEGKSLLYGGQLSDDCSTFIEAVRSLGIGVEVGSDCIAVEGCGGKLPVASGEIYVGSAGTAARFLTALCALQDGRFTLTSSPQMMRRPQRPLIEALVSLGARFEFLGEEYCFPFVVQGTSSPADEVTVNIEKSSQFLSALLMSAVCAGKPLTIQCTNCLGTLQCGACNGWGYVPLNTAGGTSGGTSVGSGSGSSGTSGSSTSGSNVCRLCGGTGKKIKEYYTGSAVTGKTKWCSTCNKEVRLAHYHVTCDLCKGKGTY